MVCQKDASVSIDFEKDPIEPYVDGEYIHDPLPKPKPVAEPTTDEILNAMLGVTV